MSRRIVLVPGKGLALPGINPREFRRFTWPPRTLEAMRKRKAELEAKREAARQRKAEKNQPHGAAGDKAVGK